MADEEMVTIPRMRNTAMLRRPHGDGKYYGPGENIRMPRRVADNMGLSYKTGTPKAATEPAEGYNGMTVADLKAEAEARELEVQRGDGKEGDPLKADYVAALETDDEAGGSTETPTGDEGGQTGGEDTPDGQGANGDTDTDTGGEEEEED